MSPPFRVAVLSYWHVHAADYARQVSNHPQTQLVAVWDDDETRGRPAAEELGTAYTDDLAALLASGDLDAVVVTTPTVDHRDVMLAAAAAGLHIFTEKLLGPTVSDAEQIVQAADAAGVQLVVSLPRLYSGSTAAVLEVIASGRLGRLTYSRVRLSHDGAVAGWLPERFFDPGAAVGGALTDLGCHPAYLTQLFLGSAPETVSATYRSVTGRAVEDHAVVTLGYADQAIGVIEAGFVNRNPFTIELHGTEGSLLFSEAEPVLHVRGPAFGSGWQTLDLPAEVTDPFRLWVDSLPQPAGSGGDSEPVADNVRRAVDLTRLVVAANASAAQGRTVAYPHP